MAIQDRVPAKARAAKPVAGGRVPQGVVLAVASFGAFLAFLDATIVNVAFPSIRESFPGTSIGTLSWVLNAYNIVFAAFLVVFGRLADLLGRRRVFVGGILLFTVASGLCALAGSVEVLVVFRVLQATGAAMLVPASLAIVVSAFPAERRAHAIGLWGATAAVASGLGPPIGGLLVELGGWQWAFLVNLPVGAVALVAARRNLVESRAPGRRRRPDVAGAVLLAGAMAALTLAIVKGSDWGWTSGAFLATLGAAVLLLAGFVASSRRHPVPLLDPALLRIRPFSVATGVTVVAGMGFYAYLLTNILWLQYVWGYPVLKAGLALVPGALVAAVVAAVLGPVAARRGYRLVVVPGALVWALAYLWYYREVGPQPAFVAQWLPGQLLSGLGVGATLPLLGSAALAAVPGGRYATASAVASSARQLGGVLGIAILVVIVGTPGAAGAVDAFRSGWLFSIVCFVGCAVLALALGTVDAHADDGVDAMANVAALVGVPEPVAPDGGGSLDAPDDPDDDTSVFARLPEAVRDRLVEQSELIEVVAGSWLIRAGDAADCLYLVVSGRLEVLLGDQVVRTLAPGAVLGELALLTGGTRSASVRARRDSVVRRVSREVFDAQVRPDPAALGALVTILADQLAGAQQPAIGRTRPTVVAVLAAHVGAPADAVAAVLARRLAADVRVVAPGRVEPATLERLEREHDRVLLVADGDDPQWAASCLRQADQVVLVSREPSPGGPVCDAVAQRRCEPDVVLVGRRASADELASWVDRLDPWHVTQTDGAALDADLRALAARIAGTSLGLVLGGGGARAFAHVGVLRELADAGLHVDRVAGTSMGAIIAAGHALGRDGEWIEATSYQQMVRGKPFSDWTLPRTSLARGRRTTALLARTLGEDTTIESLPLPFGCVSTDLASRSLHVHRRGSLVQAVTASARLPVLFAPMVSGDRLLVDGGVLDNLPVSVLTARDEGPVVAVNISMGGGGRPSDPGSARRPPRVPALGETLLRTMTIASGGAVAQARHQGAYVLTPPTLGVGLLEFHQFDVMVAAGRTAARQLLEQTGGHLR